MASPWLARLSWCCLFEDYFSGCNKTSVVVAATSGDVVATIANGTRVDALGWDPGKKLIYIPNGAEGNVTVAHQDSADRYSVVATVQTVPGAKDHHGRCQDPQRVPLSTRTWSGPGSGGRRAGAGAWSGSTRTNRRVVVRRHQAAVTDLHASGNIVK